MKIGRQFRGTPGWSDMERPTPADRYYTPTMTHRQNVSFCYANKYYVAEFRRYYDRSKPQGERTTYDLNIVRCQTGRSSEAFAKAMLEQTQWLSTFKRNVEEFAAMFLLP